MGNKKLLIWLGSHSVTEKLNLRQRRNGMRDKTCLPCVNSDLVQALLLLQGVLPANLLIKRKSGAPKKTNDFCHIVS